MSSNSVACIGECMIELSGEEGSTWRMGFAGDTFNTAWAMRALLGEGDRVDFVTAFGDDDFSDRQRDYFSEHGIGIASSPVLPGTRPGLYAITLDGSERSFTYWRSDSAARQLAHDANALAASLHGRSMIYLSGITLAILDADARAVLTESLKVARSSGALIAFDPNYRPKLWTSPDAAKSANDAVMRTADIVLPTFPDEAELHGDRSPAATAGRIAGLGVHEIVVKDGAEPALVIVDGAPSNVPAVEVANPVDTTGAGDSFSGGYLSARCLGDDPVTAAEKAHNVAAAVVQVYGALAPFEILRDAFQG